MMYDTEEIIYFVLPNEILFFFFNLLKCLNE